MGERARVLAEDFERENDDLIRLVENLSEAQWAARTEAEGWTVAAVARHIAGAHLFIGTRVQSVAEGRPPAPVDQDELHAENASDARRYATIGREEVVALLGTNGARVRDMLRGLADEQLDRTFTRPDGQAVTAAWIVENGLLGHLRGHGASIRAAVGL